MQRRNADKRADRLQETAGWLTENGYKRGYAHFWDADACVELSSGKLEIWSQDNLNYFWSLSLGQPLSHTLEIPDRPFIIVKKERGLMKSSIRNIPFSMKQNDMSFTDD